MFQVINMPANYDMLVSHSPPVFSHSPPAGFMNDVNTGYPRHYDPLRGFCRPQSIVMHHPMQQKKPLSALHIKMPVSPKRSCLVHRLAPCSPEEQIESLDFLESPELEMSENHAKTKKKVVFADDQGLSLTEVRIMSEPSNVPPHWSLQFLAHITQGWVSPIPTEQWTIDFKQPASDYLDFRRRLDKENVSLENVIVRENDSVVVGTVKVRNLSFNKEVIVRATWDNWKSQEDIFCTYSQLFQVGNTTGAYILYDTFSFKITLPPSSSSLEFCVCYRCDSQEFWDNNHGINYTLSKRTASGQEPTIISTAPTDAMIQSMNILNLNKGNNAQQGSSPISIPKNITQAKIGSWSEFASWTHLENNCPYW